jgi:hypothetical protein
MKLISQQPVLVLTARHTDKYSVYGSFSKYICKNYIAKYVKICMLFIFH